MIGLYKGKSLVSSIIKFRTWGVYSHASWICDDGRVYEAWMNGGVRCENDFHEGHTPGTEIDIFNPGFTSEQIRTVEGYLARQVGKKYDFAGVLGFFSRTAILKNVDPTPTEADAMAAAINAWFCSDLVFAACQAAGRPPLVRVPWYKVSPTVLSYSPELIYIQTVTT